MFDLLLLSPSDAGPERAHISNKRKESDRAVVKSTFSATLACSNRLDTAVSLHSTRQPSFPNV